MPAQSLDQVRQDVLESHWAEAITKVRSISDDKLRQFTSEQIQELVRLLKVAVLELESRHAQIWVYDLFERLGNLLAQTGANMPDVNLDIAKAIFNEAALLEQSGRPREAVSTYSRLIDLHSQSADIELRRLVASALIKQGLCLASMKLYGEAMDVYARVDALFSDSTDPGIRECVAKALNLSGGLLYDVDRFEEALERFEEVQRRFSNDLDIAIQERVGISMTNKSLVLARQGRSSDAIELCKAVLSQYGDDPSFWKPTSIALNEIGYLTLCEAKRLKVAGEVERADGCLSYAAELLSDSVNRRSHEPDPIILGNLGYVMFLRGDKDEARRVLGQAIALGGEDVRQAELRDSQKSPLPEDVEFRELVRTL